ncbi:MAG TPA: OmpA family protein [Verrucomicrobiae bacterium]|nr:OmpA family protein [Verrucomicrobiae bacterium]
MKKGLLFLTGMLIFASAFGQPKPTGFGDLNQKLVFTPGAGLIFPVGDFDNANDMGFSLGGGLEYFVSSRLALSANYAYQSFGDPALGVNGESFHFLGLGARGLLFKDARLNPYIRLAGGLYQASGASKAGINGGPGILYRASENVGLWAEGNAHMIFDYAAGPASNTAHFLGVSAGLMLTIPTGRQKSQAIRRKPGEPPPTAIKEEKRQEPGVLAPAGEPEMELAPVYFDFDKYHLRSDAKETLERNLEILRQNPGWKIELEGHCDEIGTEEYNISLGWKRAEVVREFLVQSGLERDRFATISYGKMRPASLGLDEAARSKNRRVEFKIVAR